MDDTIVCTNCDWSWKRAEGGDDLYICHKCGYNNFYTANDLFKGYLYFLNW